MSIAVRFCIQAKKSRGTEFGFFKSTGKNHTPQNQSFFDCFFDLPQPSRKSPPKIIGEVALLILFDAFAWLKEAGYAGVVGGKRNIQWVEFVLGCSDEYREGQAAIAADRFSKKLRANFIFLTDWHGLCGWLPLLTGAEIRNPDWG